MKGLGCAGLECFIGAGVKETGYVLAGVLSGKAEISVVCFSAEWNYTGKSRVMSYVRGSGRRWGR